MVNSMTNADKKNMVIGSMVVAGLVALAALADMIFAVPFAGQMVMDIMFLIGGGLVAYLAYDAYKDLT